VAGTDYATPASVTLPVLSAKGNCGLVMNGVTDDTTALSNCIAALPAGGGIIQFPAGTAVIGNLTIEKDNVVLLGAGAANAYGNTTPVTKFLYTGADGGFVVKLYKAFTLVKGVEIRKIGIDANGHAANGLWLRNTDGFRGIDISVFSHLGYGVIIDAASDIPNVCGAGSRAAFLDNFTIWSAAGGGLQLGTPAYDVCSHKIGRGNITWSGFPGWHGIYIATGDSNSFLDVDVGALSGKAVSSISCASNVCTITATGHGQTATDGVYLTAASDSALFGTYAGTVTGPNTITIPVTIPNGSYTASAITGASVQLGGPTCPGAATGCAWNNSFGKLLTTTGIHQFQNAVFQMYPNHVAQWNWNEVAGANFVYNGVNTSPNNNSFRYANMGTVAGFGHDGGVFNPIFRTTMQFEPPKAQTFALNFKAGSIVDYGNALDFINADPITSAGYNAMRLHNNTAIASTNASKANNISIIGVDSTDKILLGSVFNPAGTTVKVHSPLQFGSLAYPTCNAANLGVINFFNNAGAADDVLRVCIQQSGGSYAWKVIF
jgi:hypothetical protein